MTDNLCDRICEAITTADDKSMAEAGYMLDCHDCVRIVREQFASVQPGTEPTGWVTMWPAMGGGQKPVYSHGAEKPSYGPELNALLTVYPVFAAPAI